MCLFAVLSSTTAFAGAQWIGNSYININGTWYQGSGTTWAGGPYNAFNEQNFGKIATLTIGASVQVQAGNINEWGDLTDVFRYKFDDAENWSYLILNTKETNDDKRVYETGNPFALQTIDISTLGFGPHTLYIAFEVDGKTDNGMSGSYSATFTKVVDISGAIVTNVDGSYDWTGSAINPEPVVTFGGNELNSVTDYDVSYSEGCTKVGTYSVIITGKGEYVGTKTVNFNINDVYYLYGVIGSKSNYSPNESYKLSKNTEAEGEYYINDVALSNGDYFKVASPGRGEWGTWYPDGTENDYQINDNGIYNIYFRPDGNGGGDWYYHTFYVAYQHDELTVDVTLAPTGYGTYYHGKCDVILPSGTVAYILTGVNNDKPTYKMIADGDDNGNNTIPAGTAVLLYNSQKPASVTLTLTTLSATNSDTNLLKGSDVQTTTTGGAKYYKLTYGNDNTTFGWYYGEDEGAAFTSPAHKAWLALPSTNARVFLGLPGDNSTGIATIENKQQKADNVWYDLNGRHINALLTKGIYVKDGRKVVIK